jgi:hypothetical protein
MEVEATLFEPAYPVGFEISGRGSKVCLLLHPQDLEGLTQAVRARRGTERFKYPITDEVAEESLIKGAFLEPVLLRMDMEQVRRSGGLRVARLLVAAGFWLRLKPYEDHARLGLSKETLDGLKQ